MADFSKVLLVCDFDLTLSNHAGQVPRQNLDALHAFVAQGGTFTVATGRGLSMFLEPMQHLPICAPVLVSNGAACYDAAHRQPVFCHALPESMDTVVTQLRRQFPAVRLELQCLDANYAFGADPFRDQLLQKSQTTVKKVPLSQVPHPRLTCSLYGAFKGPYYPRAAEITPAERAQFVEIYDYLNEHYHTEYTITHSMPLIVEMQKKGVTKGRSARQLMQQLQKQILVCAGDSPNDLSMLHAADIAFKTGDCAPALQPLPFHKTCSCDEGAIASLLQQLPALL